MRLAPSTRSSVLQATIAQLALMSLLSAKLASSVLMSRPLLPPVLRATTVPTRKQTSTLSVQRVPTVLRGPSPPLLVPLAPTLSTTPTTTTNRMSAMYASRAPTLPLPALLNVCPAHPATPAKEAPSPPLLLISPLIKEKYVQLASTVPRAPGIQSPVQRAPTSPTLESHQVLLVSSVLRTSSQRRKVRPNASPVAAMLTT